MGSRDVRLVRLVVEGLVSHSVGVEMPLESENRSLQ